MINSDELFKTKALPFVIKSEGGYSHNPNDKGGMTYKGITQSVYNAYRKSKKLNPQPIGTEYATGSVPKGLKFVHYKLTINKVVVKNVDVVIHITDAEIYDIYYHNYWLEAGCNEMSKVFAVIAFDTAVNMGAGVVEATGMTRVQEFMKAAEYKDPDKFIQARIAKYKEFAKAPSQRGFLKGWLNRMDALEAYIKTI